MKIVVLDFSRKCVDIIDVNGVHSNSADEFLARQGWDISQIEWFILEGEAAAHGVAVNVHRFHETAEGPLRREVFRSLLGKV